MVYHSRTNRNIVSLLSFTISKTQKVFYIFVFIWLIIIKVWLIKVASLSNFDFDKLNMFNPEQNLDGRPPGKSQEYPLDFEVKYIP